MLRVGGLPWLVAALLPLGCGRDAAPTAATPAGAESAAHAAPRRSAMPDTFAEAVAWVSSRITEIRTHLERNQPHSAHDALDELAEELFRLPSVARDGGVPRKQWEAVNVSARAIRNGLDQVHERIDAEQAVDWKTLGAPVEAALATLTETAKTPPSSEESR
jgi:hypothetical protein